MGEMRNSYIVVLGNPEGKRPLGIPRHRCDTNIKINLTVIVWEGVDWIHLAQDRFM
jgi:hypothetical protein